MTGELEVSLTFTCNEAKRLIGVKFAQKVENKRYFISVALIDSDNVKVLHQNQN